jgi:hypothetical protein
LIDSHHYLARILPIVGAALADQRLALAGCAAGQQLAELLASSGIMRWALVSEGPADSAAHALAADLERQYGALNGWECSVLAPEEIAGPLDLVVMAGANQQAVRLASSAGCPLVQLLEHPPAGPYQWPYGFYIEQIDARHYLANDPFGAAAFARALLLHNSPYERPDIEALVGAAVPQLAPYHTPRQAPALTTRSAMIIGCGSLGSYIAAELATTVQRLVLVDPGNVSAYNPIRQCYRSDQIGAPKVLALADELVRRHGSQAAELIPLRQQLSTEEQIEPLLARYNPDLVVLATGTNADFALARALRSAGIAHLAARCYNRARFWEAIVVPTTDGPCLGCLRGQLYIGAQPPATPEEAAAYVAPGELVAEPATLIESGWAAQCIAELAIQCLAPDGLREQWFRRAVVAQQTCFIGGAYAVRAADQQWAYGIERPGQVQAYGAAQIAGSATERICADCGRRWNVYYRVD